MVLYVMWYTMVTYVIFYVLYRDLYNIFSYGLIRDLSKFKVAFMELI